MQAQNLTQASITATTSANMVVRNHQDSKGRNVNPPEPEGLERKGQWREGQKSTLGNPDYRETPIGQRLLITKLDVKGEIPSIASALAKAERPSTPYVFVDGECVLLSDLPPIPFEVIMGEYVPLIDVLPVVSSDEAPPSTDDAQSATHHNPFSCETFCLEDCLKTCWDFSPASVMNFKKWCEEEEPIRPSKVLNRSLITDTRKMWRRSEKAVMDGKPAYVVDEACELALSYEKHRDEMIRLFGLLERVGKVDERFMSAAGLREEQWERKRSERVTEKGSLAISLLSDVTTSLLGSRFSALSTQ